MVLDLAKIESLKIGETREIDKYEDPELIDKLKPAESYDQSMIEHMFGERQQKGLELPWRCTHDKFRLRPGELTIWAGENGSGKSLMLTQAMLSVIRQNSVAVIASLELHPVETLKRMACQFSRIHEDQIGEKAVYEFIDFVTDGLWLYDEAGDMKPKRVSAMARYSRAELNADHLVIDSLMKCGTTEGDYAAEKKFVNSLQNIAKQTGLHIHLVAHSRKPGDGKLRGKYEVKGSGTITDMADNVLTVSRNRTKEAEKKKVDQKEGTMSKPDTYLVCDKQRHYTWEGIFGLWFHESGAFTGNPQL